MRPHFRDNYDHGILRQIEPEALSALNWLNHQSRHFSIHIRFGGRRLHFRQRNRSRNDQA